MPAVDPKMAAVEMTLQAQRHADASDAYIRSELQDVFGGTLYTVSWKNGKEGGKSFDNYVFNDNKRLHHFFNPPELARFLNQRQPRNPFLALLRELLTVGGAPAVIAIVITMTICWLAISPNGKTAPDILGHALTTILGFYFGSKVTGKASQSLGSEA